MIAVVLMLLACLDQPSRHAPSRQQLVVAIICMGKVELSKSKGRTIWRPHPCIMRFSNVGFGKMTIGEVGFGEMGIGKVGFGKVRFGEVGFGKVGIGKVGFGKVGIGDVGFGDRGFGDVGFGDVGFGEVGGQRIALH